MNKRIRKSGLSSKEICFQRDQIQNVNKQIDDIKIAERITEDREKKHPKANAKPPANIKIGNNVFLKNDMSKMRLRELYIVIQVFNDNTELMNVKFWLVK